jgi:imidazolonepropionase-like amidohydrolase
MYDLAIRNATVFDGEATLPTPTNIGILDGSIAYLGGGDVPTRVAIDGSGLTLLPGLIDTHVHLMDFLTIKDLSLMDEYLSRKLGERLTCFLNHGVASIKSLGDPEDEILVARSHIEAGRLVGSRLFVVGTAFTAPNGHPSATIYRNNPWYRKRTTFETDSPEAAREVVRRLSDKGADAIKILYPGGNPCGCGAPYLWRSRVSDVRIQISA